MRFVVECFSEAGQLDLVLSHHILLVTADSWGEGSCCQHVIEILRDLFAMLFGSQRLSALRLRGQIGRAHV